MTLQDLHMLRMDLDGAALMRFAAAQGLAQGDDDGFGYTLHAWLTAMFGALAPKPFRLQGDSDKYPSTLLGYAQADQAELMGHAQAFADPLALTVLRPNSLVSKLMPTTWRIGQHLRLDVLACPMTRKIGIEKDAYLRALDRLGEATPSRADVYADWLIKQLEGAVNPVSVRIDGLSRSRMTRRAAAPGGGRRLISIERPQVLFSLLAEIRDTEAFMQILRRGVGRHRAFGFGMLLLKPAK